MGMHCESQPWHGLEASSIPTQDTLCQFVFQTGMLFSFTPCGPVEPERTFTLVLVGVHAYIWRRGMDARNASITSLISKLPSCCLCSVPKSFEEMGIAKVCQVRCASSRVYSFPSNNRGLRVSTFVFLQSIVSPLGTWTRIRL